MAEKRLSSRSKYDWDKIRDEYVSGGMTLAFIAEQYGIPMGTLGHRAAKEGWTDLRRGRSKGGVTSTERAPDKLERLREISDVITKKISDAVNDERQFNRYLVSEKAMDENGKPITVTREMCFEKLDIKSLKEMTSALKVLSECVKELYDPGEYGAGSDDGNAENKKNEITVRFIDTDEYAD